MLHDQVTCWPVGIVVDDIKIVQTRVSEPRTGPSVENDIIPDVVVIYSLVGRPELHVESVSAEENVVMDDARIAGIVLCVDPMSVSERCIVPPIVIDKTSVDRITSYNVCYTKLLRGFHSRCHGDSSDCVAIAVSLIRDLRRDRNNFV